MAGDIDDQLTDSRESTYYNLRHFLARETSRREDKRPDLIPDNGVDGHLAPPDIVVFRQDHPTALTGLCQPHLIRGGGVKVIVMNTHLNTGPMQRFRHMVLSHRPIDEHD
jgi:hypothetical protein